jgi:hypothetical protein
MPANNASAPLFLDLNMKFRGANLPAQAVAASSVAGFAFVRAWKFLPVLENS